MDLALSAVYELILDLIDLVVTLRFCFKPTFYTRSVDLHEPYNMERKTGL